MIAVEAHAEIESQIASCVDVILNVGRSLPACTVIVKEKCVGEDELLNLFGQIGFFLEQLSEIGYGHCERFSNGETCQLEARLYRVPALLPRERSKHSINRMMPRLLGKHRADHLIAAQVRRVVSLVSGQLTHQAMRENVLP